MGATRCVAANLNVRLLRGPLKITNLKFVPSKSQTLSKGYWSFSQRVGSNNVMKFFELTYEKCGDFSRDLWKKHKMKYWQLVST